MQQLDKALADYSKAIELSPNYAKALDNRAAIRRTLGDLEGTQADLSRALQADPAYFVVYNGRGILQAMQGEFAGAVNNWLQSVQMSPNNAYYVRFYAALYLRRMGKDPAPAGLAAVMGGWKDDWRKMIGRYLQGQLPEADFLAASETGTFRTVPELRCEAFYFAGMMHLLDQDAAGAREFFMKAMGTGFRSAQTYSLATAALARMKTA